MEINQRFVDDRGALLRAYGEFLDKSEGLGEREGLEAFAKLYLDFFPLDAWLGRQLSDLHGFLQSLRLFAKQSVEDQPRVEVFNPNLDEHGWLCGRTVILVLQRDMPFLVDSIRLALNLRELPLHVVQSTVMTMHRDEGGVLQSVAAHAPEKGVSQSDSEALIYIETSLHTDEAVLHDIRRDITTVLSDVTHVVRDYRAAVEHVDQAIENLAGRGPQAEETLAFLTWLKSSHFTFLGYRSYTLVGEGKDIAVCEQLEARTGVFRKLNSREPVEVSLHSSQGMEAFHNSDTLICFSKSSTRSNVHRGVYPDYIVIKRFDEKGKVCGEIRFLGLFTYAVHSLSPTDIPIVRKKVADIISRSKLDTQGYYGKNLIRVIENFPKDEFFQSDVDTLYRNVWSVASINERHVVRLIARADPFGSFVNFMVYVPRDLYSTQVRIQIERLIGEALQSHECDSTTYFSESTLARALLVFKIPDDAVVNLDLPALESEIVEITRTWEEQLHDALVEQLGEAKGIATLQKFHSAFSKSYQEHYDARTAVADIALLEQLRSDQDIAMHLYRPLGAPEDSLRFKVLHLNNALELSLVIPILENLGLRVLGEHPYKIRLADGQYAWLHDFALAFGLPVNLDVHAVRNHFEEAFFNVWRGECESDPFNRLVLGARLSWREVSLLRAYAAYLQQIRFNNTQQFIANTLVNHPDITRNLIALFRAHFDPRVNKGDESSETRIERLTSKVYEGLDGVSNLNEDLALRRYLELIQGSLRTNYFQLGSDKSYRDCLALKLSPRDIPDIPEPKPLYEIFVYSPRIEGVHLRGGKVARGGLRWSDRLQDYRTEVLGLVKAQQVKNAVIVPQGAKGGFVAKYADRMNGRSALMDEGVACYKIFIQGLLDVTDNLMEGQVVPPSQVIRKDGDDPYFVVAADKGTASFSDIANEISLNNGFWLGDAFASGGSQGYDHKGMGITARGAWVSVQRHFREKGIDIQSERFTVLGIGDMGGDVFGNGMLLSESIALVAAFNHLHIFIDPNPDLDKSFKERTRLFGTQGATWADFSSDIISKGGGVFSRSAKSISITSEMKALFDLNKDKMPPNDLLKALLKSPVDLIWNGGIGTYVKASWETHSEVGDKANDILRVDGSELQCRVFGEGGNLGMTQLGRVEFCLEGGACNTDFIDNAAGVDCSDHEVNIKILLDELVQQGDMTAKQRNRLLADMTDSVADLVLQNNARQTLAISLAEHEVGHRLNEYRRFISFLENQGRLDRALEFIPSDEQIVERQGRGKTLMRPELAVLISYAKNLLKESLVDSDIAEDPYIAGEVETAFPQTLREQFHDQIHSHRLRAEIVATQVANDFINNLGITAGHRLMETTGASLVHLARAYVVSRDIFRFEAFHHYLESLDNRVPADFQYELMANLMRRVRRGTRWFLRNRRQAFDVPDTVERFRDGLREVHSGMKNYVQGTAREEWQARCDALDQHEVPDEWRLLLAMPGNLFSGLSVVEVAQDRSEPIDRVAQVFFALLDRLGLNWFATQISTVRVESYWQALARESFIDDLEVQLRSLTQVLLTRWVDGEFDEVYRTWHAEYDYAVTRWRHIVNEVQSSQQTDYAQFSVAMRELVDVVRSTEQS